MSLRLILASFLTLIVSTSIAGWDPDRDAESRQAIAEFKKADPSLQRFFNAAHAYAVFPSVGKGGLWIGGAYGDGVVFKMAGLSPTPA